MNWKKKLTSTSTFFVFLVIFIIIVDFLDIGIAPGIGLFSREIKISIVDLVLFITLYLTARSTKEAIRQTEITLRPYIRFAWNADYKSGDRREQGITDTCIVVVNCGKGLMRRVSYTVKVNGKEVPVRSHSIIEPNPGGTTMVYGDSAEELLGSRNDPNWFTDNNKIIREDGIEITGQYRDVEGGRYSFHFVSDLQEQSWFCDKSLQKKRN